MMVWSIFTILIMAAHSDEILALSKAVVAAKSFPAELPFNLVHTA